MRDAGRGDPQIGSAVGDDVAAGVEESEEQSELNHDQHQREHDAGKRHGQPDAVVNEILPSKT